MVKALSLLLLLSPLCAQEKSVAIDHFLGQNDSESPAIINDYEAQDALNVESNLGGTAILKRKGFTRECALTIATSPVNGSYSFIDANGNTLDIICHDHFCAKRTNGGACTNFVTDAGISGGANPTRWSFVDIGGKLYMANDKREAIRQYDGASVTNPATMPAGSLLELTKDRLTVSDTSSNPNRINYSQQGVYTFFTVGVNSQDAYNDDIGSSGDRVTATKYYNGRFYIFKNQGVTQCILADQYTSRCTILTQAVGTRDPLSIVSGPDGLYFRGSDLNYWKYSDSGGFEIISKKIGTLVKSQTAGSTRSNTQTGQNDWQLGTQTPNGVWNTSTTVGSIFPSSVTFVDTSSSDFSGGTYGQTTSTDAFSVSIASRAYFIYNGSFETGDLTYWTCATSGGGDACSVSASFAIDGTYGASVANNGSCVSGFATVVRLLSPADVILYSDQVVNGSSQRLVSGTIDAKAAGVSSQTIKIQFEAYAGAGAGGQSILTSSTFTAISTISWSGVAGGCGTSQWAKIDSIRANRYFDQSQSSGTFVYYSRSFDVAYSSTVVGGPLDVTLSTAPGTNVLFQTRSSGSVVYGAWSTVADLGRIPETRRYWQYLSSFTTSIGTVTPRIESVSLAAATTGQFYTQCIQPNTSISAWGILSCAETKTGAGSLSYFTRSDQACSYLSTGAWTAQTNNATVLVSTGLAVSIRFDSLLGSATDQAQVDACTIYWNEGTVAPPVSGTYDSIRNAIYWGTSINNSTYNNRTLKYDLNLLHWYPFDIPASGLRTINSAVYFGSSNGGYWNRYAPSGVDTDNGSAITAYWKSKDFGGDNPFIEKKFQKVSMVARNAGTGSLTSTYTLSNSSSSAYSISLATITAIPYIRSNFYLPQMSGQNFMNVKIGNSAGSSPFEVLGLRIDFTEFPWRVMNP